MFGQGPSSIERFDRMRRVVIGADLAGDITLGQAYDQVKSLPEARNLPAGVRIQESGDVETMTEAFSSFTNAMGAGLLMVLAILVVLFGNISQPITILLSLPFSIGGAILALLLTNNPFSLPVIIGILMLMGIVAKNAIMLVDFAAEEERRGVPRLMAIIDAGRKRARPIIMTTVAMVAGMLPSTLGTGDGGEFQAPMAITVVGGLIVSTAMSLIFVPSLYVVIKGTSECIAQGLRHFVHSPDRLMPAGKPVKAIAPPGNDGQAATLTEPVN
jgi:multidrug efflux pump subunit AcrB